MKSLIVKYINNTNKNIFVTGKAGTGKTTFLHELHKHTPKSMIISAPTGVAAINANGITLHSLFQLPFGGFIPDNDGRDETSSATEIHTPQTLLKTVKMHGSKRNMLRSVELLVIDEVSMLRADTLDAIDVLLKSIRRNYNLPFGGLQVLFIGDLWQLPPVAKRDEQAVLSRYYKSMFFFDSRVVQDNPLIYIELEKIYRQENPQFISLLNNLRQNKLTDDDVALLNTKYSSDASLVEKSDAIYLATHNAQADEINRQRLQKISSPSFFFDAVISKNFKESQYPCEVQLELKLGARVMFIKNDISGQQRYYNGRIGEVCRLSEDLIQVEFEDGSIVDVELYQWENSRYTLNKTTGELEKIVEGTFEQYPLRLAWAITIHKSQGLTFERAVIDVENIFASGQAYVAFSRLRSLEGLILAKPMRPNSIGIDKDIIEYSRNKLSEKSLEDSLPSLSRQYFLSYIPDSFSFSDLRDTITDYLLSFNKNENRSARQAYEGRVRSWLDKTENLYKVGRQFEIQIVKIIQNNDNYVNRLYERIVKAIAYFEPILKSVYLDITELVKEVSDERGTKKFVTELVALSGKFIDKQKKMYKISTLLKSIMDNTDYSFANVKSVEYFDESVASKSKKTSSSSKPRSSKKPKTDTKLISYEMHKSGMTIAEIARERGLKADTIFGHLTYYVQLGELNALNFITKSKFDRINTMIEENKRLSMKELKEKLDDDISYADIKLVLASIQARKSED